MKETDIARRYCCFCIFFCQTFSVKKKTCKTPNTVFQYMVVVCILFFELTFKKQTLTSVRESTESCIISIQPLKVAT